MRTKRDWKTKLTLERARTAQEKLTKEFDALWPGKRFFMSGVSDGVDVNLIVERVGKPSFVTVWFDPEGNNVTEEFELLECDYEPSLFESEKSERNITEITFPYDVEISCIYWNTKQDRLEKISLHSSFLMGPPELL